MPKHRADAAAALDAFCLCADGCEVDGGGANADSFGGGDGRVDSHAAGGVFGAVRKLIVFVNIAINSYVYG